MSSSASPPTTEVRVFAPGSVSNVACGFDVLGFAVAGPGDLVVARQRAQRGVCIRHIEGDGGVLPRAVERNTSSVAAAAVLRSSNHLEAGVELDIYKQMPLSSGLGSSAASAVAAALATSRLLGLDDDREMLLRAALAGEQVASGGLHPDNIAPCLYGGFVLARGVDPPLVTELPVPPGLTCALVRAHVEVATKESRALLGDTVRLGDAVRQWGNLGGLVAALYCADFELLSSCLDDTIAEPLRGPGVAGFSAAKTAALKAGALGCSLSGSGPSVFALCRTPAEAETVSLAMAAAIEAEGLPCDRLVSPVGARGAHQLTNPAA